MTEDHAPGWWRASDGSWYPPEQHHDPEHRARFADGAPASSSASSPAPAPSSGSFAPPPPTPPGPGRSILPKAAPRRELGTILTVIAAVLVVIGVGVGSYLLAGGGDDDEPSDDDGPSTTAPGGGEAVEVTVDNISFSLPAGWVTARPGSGETGEERFPDDQPLAGAFDDNLEQAEDQGALLFGLDTDLTSQSALTVTRFEDVTLDEVTDGARASLEAAPGVSIAIDRTVALAEDEGYLFRYRFPRSPGTPSAGEAIGVQLLVPDGDDVYALVFSAADDETARELVALANSIVVE